MGWKNAGDFFYREPEEGLTPIQKLLLEAAEKDVRPEGTRCPVPGCRAQKYYETPAALASHQRMAHPAKFPRGY